MYRPRDYHLLLLSEIRQKKTNRIFTDHITAMRNLKHDTNELIYKTETDSQTLKKTWLPKGRGRGRGRGHQRERRQGHKGWGGGQGEQQVE